LEENTFRPPEEKTMKIHFVNRLFWSAIALSAVVGLSLPGLAQASRPAAPPPPGNAAASSARLKKLSAADKAKIFGTPETWQQKYDARFQTAPPDIQQRILKERADIQTRKKRYAVGYTSMSGPAEKKLTGLVGLPPALKTPPPYTPVNPVQPSCLEESAQPSQPAVDMTDYAIVTPVRDQGGCGDCWAFATTAALETAVLRENGNSQGVTNTTLALSEEQVLSCTGPTDFIFGITISGDNCGGGLQPSAANYVRGHDIVTNSSWPYSGQTQTNQCSKFQSQSTPYRAKDWGWICDPGGGGILGALAVLSGIQSNCLTPSNEAIKQAIVDHGSVAASFNVGGDCPGQAFCDYSGGVFDENNNSSFLSVPFVDHVIQIIGWDDAQGAWRIKNSWGTDWGENGFAWVAYNTSNIGSYAIWVDADQYNNACTVQAGLKFPKITVDITTGSDDARNNSEIYATLNNGYEFCLKPSSSGPTAHCRLPKNVDQNGVNDWGSFYTNSKPQTFNLPMQDQSIESMTITLVSHSGTFESPDNWNIQALTVMGYDQNGGEHRLFTLGSPDDHNGNDCFARLKDQPNSESVTLSLDGTNKHTYSGGKANGHVSACENNGG
jgi:cathepsin L